MRVVMIGPPGSGKGTQGALAADLLGLPRIVAGDLVRAEALGDTAVAARIAETMRRGDLVADEIVDEIVLSSIRENTEGFILDGYPRTVPQAAKLDALLGKAAASVDAAIRFHLPPGEAERRMLARGRADDHRAAIDRRMRTYAEIESSMIDHYRSVIVELDAYGPVDEVASRLMNALRDVARDA